MGLGLAEPGFHTRAYVEWEEYPRSTIIAAQRAGYFAPAPIWDDLTTFDARPFAGAIDTVLAGYPCQPFSYAGQRKGEDDPRHLWPHVARVIAELGDGLRWVFLENVSGHVTLGGEAVLRALRDMGFTPAVGIFTAAETCAPHKRERWFCVAYKPGGGCGEQRDAAQPGRGRHADGGGGSLYEGSRPEGGRKADAGRSGADVDDTLTLGRVEGRNRDYAGNVGQQSDPEGQPVADTDGRNPSAEWEQRGREQRFQPQGGNVGGQALDDAAGARCDSTGAGPATNGQGRERLLGAGCDGVADANRGNGDGGRGRGSGWGSEPANGGGSLADASQPGLQGRERAGSPDQRDRTPAYGPTAERGSPFLFPPGPGDRDAWSYVASAAPSLLPAVSRRDIYTAARRLAAMVSPDTAARIFDRTTGLESLDRLAALVREKIAVVEQAEAVTALCLLAHGMARRTRALRLLGNGVHPLAASHAWRTLSAAHGLRPVDMDAASIGQAKPTGDVLK